MKGNVGFISTRFAGTDGVSLEASKWADSFNQNGYACFWFAGQLERDPNRSFEVPEAHFQYEKTKWINAEVFGRKTRDPDVTRTIHALRSYLKHCLYEFVRHFEIDVIIAENIFSIPMHIPLAMALTETLAETQIPAIAHHHDFYWERARYSVNAVGDYLAMAFPPALPNIEHVVINSDAQQELARRTGIVSTIIPNVLDFENPPRVDTSRAQAFRDTLGLKPDDRMILQPTRVIQRKGIEHAIELVQKLGDARNKLVISHEAGDEGFAYAQWLEGLARERGVDLRFADACIGDPWHNHNGNGKKFSLWDIYPCADFVTYPSLQEGFGNAFLESIYLKKPLLINRYATFISDIEPQGFDLVVMDSYLSEQNVHQVRDIMESPLRSKQMVNTNYQTAARHYSYAVLGGRLGSILSSLPERAYPGSVPEADGAEYSASAAIIPYVAARHAAIGAENLTPSLKVGQI